MSLDPTLYIRSPLHKALGIPTPEQGLRQAEAATQRLVGKQQHEIEAESERARHAAEQASAHAAADADHAFDAKVRHDNARLEALRRAIEALDHD